MMMVENHVYVDDEKKSFMVDRWIGFIVDGRLSYFAMLVHSIMFVNI